jgi:GTP pyrophosphokinase
MRPIRGIHLENIIESLREYQPEADVDSILKAYTFASQVHGGQTRLSGQPYMNHPMEVAMILTRLKMDPKAITTSLLHDTVEDTNATTADIKKHFGQEIASMVEGLTKLAKITFTSHEQRQAENVRKMILAMSQDIRIVIIKLADRLHNMRTLEFLAPQRQNAISQETLDIYAPLANRLGISWLKAELEDLAFKYVYPIEYGELKKEMEQQRSELDEAILAICNKTHELLRKERISGEVSGRTKNLYSIYSKMREQNLEFEQVHDVIGVRIITNSLLNCYKVLGLIHSTWKPVPEMVKDYIAVPKENMYQSIHTTVVEPTAKRVEFQIRTQAMHNINEDGIAAHWRYKDGKKKGDTNDENFVWVRRLLELGMSIDNPEEFLDNVKTDLFPEEVYVFTPQQEVLAFPKGCTPLDFAYAVHTDIGHKCKAALVNSKEVSLNYRLQNGDTVEIITSHDQQPSRLWLNMVQSSPAKAKILSYIRSKEKADSIKLGRAIIEAEISKYGLGPKTYMTDEALDAATEKLGYKTSDLLLQKVGFSKVPIYGLLEKLLPPKAWEKVETARKTSLKGVFKKLTGMNKRKAQGVLVGDVDNMLIRFAGCCNPVPGDSILGYVSGGQGMVIHNKSCPLLKKLEPDPEKYIETRWDMGFKKHLRPVRILAYSINRPGILASVSTAIADCDANISNAVVTPTDRKGGRLDITVEIEDLPHLERVIKAVKNVGGVKYVNRIMESSSKE